MAYQVPPHTNQFYPTDIPMYYNNTKSQLDILKQHPAYSYFDPSKVTFDDIGEGVGAMYEGDKDRTILNTLYTNPQSIKPRDLEYLGHETVHRTFDESPFKGVLPVSTPKVRHGIPAAVDLLYGPLEARMNPELKKSLLTSPYLNESDFVQKGPKRAHPNEILPFSGQEGNESVPRRTEHLLNYTLDNMIYGNEKPLYDIFPSNYDQRFINEIAGGDETYELPGIMYGARKYYPPRNAYSGNAPGEVRRGIMGLKDSFRTGARKYIDIMRNYDKRNIPETSSNVPGTPIVPMDAGRGSDQAPRSFDPGAAQPQRQTQPGGFTNPGRGSYGPWMSHGGLAGILEV